LDGNEVERKGREGSVTDGRGLEWITKYNQLVIKKDWRGEESRGLERNGMERITKYNQLVINIGLGRIGW
jgi:hypothetical protein